MSKTVTLPKLKAKAQLVFNAYIRERDSENGYFQCISCKEFKPISSMHAGHFYNVGHYDSLRYEEDNCHGQCNHCNTFLHGNLIEYRDNLFFKIGAKRFDDLKIKAGLYKRNGYKFSRSELVEIIAFYKQKINGLEASF